MVIGYQSNQTQWTSHRLIAVQFKRMKCHHLYRLTTAPQVRYTISHNCSQTFNVLKSIVVLLQPITTMWHSIYKIKHMVLLTSQQVILPNYKCFVPLQEYQLEALKLPTRSNLVQMNLQLSLNSQSQWVIGIPRTISLCRSQHQPCSRIGIVVVQYPVLWILKLLTLQLTSVIHSKLVCLI